MIHSFKRLWPYLRLHRKALLVMFALGLGVTLSGGLVPIVGQTLIEIYQRKTDLSLLNKIMPQLGFAHLANSTDARQFVEHWLPLCFPLLYLIWGLFRYFHYTLLNFTAEKIIGSLRTDLVQKIMRLNMTYHNSLERGSGGLLSRVFNDTNLLQQGLNFYADLIREPIQAMIYLSYMIWVDWQLTLFSIIFLPFFFFVTRKVIKSLRKYGNRSRDSMEDLTAVLKETVDGLRVVQSFNLEKEMSQRFQTTLQTYLHNMKKIIMREQAVSPLNEFVISFLVMGFAFYSIKEVVSGQADAAKFIGFMLAAGFLQAPIKKLQDAGVKIQQSIVLTERVFSIIESTSQVPQPIQPRPFPLNWKTITFKNVCFSYGKEMVLKKVNLTVNRGDVIALVGESGSGKSTLVNLLERFFDPTDGEIFIDDININQISLSELRAHIALVTQDVFLFRDSIARNIQAGDFQKDVSGVQAVAKAANADNFISAMPMGYESPVGERGSFLSGGEKQRVSIARAMFKDAPILILDEATSALDSVSELEVQKGINKLMEGRTAFVIAHRLSTIFSASRILVMRKGEIVEDGNHQTLLALEGEYYHYYQLQMNHVERAARLN